MSTERSTARENGEMFYTSQRPCEKHGSHLRYASSGRCPDCAEESAEDSKLATGEQKLPSLYHAGRISRSNKRPKVPPSLITWADRHWWLAGWNDRDMELQP